MNFFTKPFAIIKTCSLAVAFLLIWSCANCPVPTNVNITHTYDSLTGNLTLNYTWDAALNSTGYQLEITKNGGTPATQSVTTNSYSETITPPLPQSINTKITNKCDQAVSSGYVEIGIKITTVVASDTTVTVDVDVL